jgi:ABC-2 type transport system permease protein
VINVVTRKLIAKELHVYRWLIAGGAAASILSLIVCALGKLGFSIGSLTWLTTIIALGVMLALYGIMNERKDQSLTFVLSLPLSIADYVRAKMLGLLLCFLAVWLVASAGAMVLIFTVESIPDGLAPYTVLLCFYMLANYAVVLSGTVHAQSEALTSAVIVVTNMGVSVFMFTVGPLPGLQKYMWQATPEWNSTFWTVLGCELAVLAIAFAIPFFVAARRRDFL